MRSIWLILGITSIALGVMGAFLPLLPTVPFLLLSAYCFSRSSERLHVWLVNHPVFGPAIADWRERGAISLKAKRLATASVAMVMALSLVFGLRTEIMLLQAAILGCVLIFIWTRPHQ